MEDGRWNSAAILHPLSSNLYPHVSVAWLLTACRSRPPSETAELRQAMRQQMNAQREQLKASGATHAAPTCCQRPAGSSIQARGIANRVKSEPATAQRAAWPSLICRRDARQHVDAA